MKSYIFHVSIPGTGRTWRKIELPAHYTLSHLHHAIQKVFRFGNDHLYSFFMSGKAWDNNTDYRLPHGMGPWEVGELKSPEEAELEAKREREAREKQEALQREAMRKEMQEILQNTDSTNKRIPIYVDSGTTSRWGKPPGNVLTTTLISLNLKRKQTFMYMFDYGDEWRFKVRVHAINENADPNAEYPRIVESVGTPPRQYRSWG